MKRIKIKKEWGVYLAGGLFAAAALGFLLRPLGWAFHKTRDEVQSLRGEMAAAREAMAWREHFQHSGRLLNRSEISRAMDEITKTGSALNITFVSTSPQNIVVPEGQSYPVLPIQMEIVGDYKNFGQFLGALGQLKQSIVTIESFHVTLKGAGSPLLRAKLTAHLYLRKGQDG